MFIRRELGYAKQGAEEKQLVKINDCFIDEATHEKDVASLSPFAERLKMQNWMMLHHSSINHLH